MSNIFPSIPTTLDLNGPELEFTTNPVDFTTSVADGTATFTAVAQATFPVGQTDRNENSGTIAYQWLRDGVPLVNETNVSGATSSTLTLSGLTNPDDTGSTILCKADYVPSAYDAGLTGNAYNEPISSDTAILTVSPTISSSTVANASTNELESTSITASATVSDNTDNQLSYSWFVDGVSLSTNPEGFIFSGNNTKNLTITKNAPGFHKLTCRISHPTADPAFITTNESNLEIKATRDVIRYQIVNENSTNDVRSGDRNFSNAPGTLFFQADPDAQSTGQKFQTSKVIFLHAVERDVTLKITMAGAAGENLGSYSGGQGGLSVFKVTLKKGVEHAIRLGVNSDQSFNGIIGGDSGVGGGGGGLAVMYRKAQVIAVCGGGGGAGTGGDGGNGGGIGIAGQNGGSGGNGGALVGIDLLSGGFDNSGTTGGALSECTGSCDDIGLSRYTNASGTTYSSTDSIERGYRSNQGFRTNGGDSSGNQGAGGAGARGGSAATSSNGGGGGGSGYQSSEIELLSSTTLPGGTGTGGNAEVGFVGIEVFDEDASKEPSIPDPTEDIRTVEFDVTRNTSNENEIILTKNGSGFGPNTIKLGPTSGKLKADIGEGVVYDVTSLNTNTSGIKVKLSGNTLFADDNIGSGPDPIKSSFADGDYDDLTVTPSLGEFTSNSSWTANWTYPFQAAPTPPSEPAEEDVRRVKFVIEENSTPYNTTLTFRKNSLKTGPNEFTLDSSLPVVSIDVGEGVQYNLVSSSTNSAGIDIKLSGNCLFVDDDQGNLLYGYDNDYDDMIITPRLGKFNSTNNWEADWSVSTSDHPSPPSGTPVPPANPIASLSVDKNSVTLGGENYELEWNSINGIDYELTIEFGGITFTAVNNPGASGSQIITPTQAGTYTYTYTVFGSAGTSDSASVTVSALEGIPTASITIGSYPDNITYPTSTLPDGFVENIREDDYFYFNLRTTNRLSAEVTDENGFVIIPNSFFDGSNNSDDFRVLSVANLPYGQTSGTKTYTLTVNGVDGQVVTDSVNIAIDEYFLFQGNAFDYYFQGMNSSWDPNAGQYFYHLNWRQNDAFFSNGYGTEALIEENFVYCFHPTTYPNHPAIVQLTNTGLNGPDRGTTTTQDTKKRLWDAQWTDSNGVGITRPIGSWPLYRFDSSNFTSPWNKFYTFDYNVAEQVIRDGGPIGPNGESAVNRGFKLVDHYGNALGTTPKPAYYGYRRKIHPDDEPIYNQTFSNSNDLINPRFYGYMYINVGDDGKTEEGSTYDVERTFNDREDAIRSVAGKGSYIGMRGRGYANSANCTGRRYYGFMYMTANFFPENNRPSSNNSRSGGGNRPGIWTSSSGVGYKIKSGACSSG